MTLVVAPPYKPPYRWIRHQIGDQSTNTTRALVQRTSHQARGIGDRFDPSVTLVVALPLRPPCSLKVFHLYTSLSFSLLHDQVDGFGVCSLILLAFAVKCGVSETLCLSLSLVFIWRLKNENELMKWLSLSLSLYDSLSLSLWCLNYNWLALLLSL